MPKKPSHKITLRDDSLPLELLDEKDLVERAITERRQRAEKERMRISSSDSSTPWADYTVTNAESGKSYRVAMRGMGEHESYCSCPDFRTNHLGLCKHTLRVKAEVEKRFSRKQLAVPHEQTEFAIHAVYGKELGVRLLVPGNWVHPRLKRFTAKLQQTPLQIVRLPDFAQIPMEDGSGALFGSECSAGAWTGSGSPGPIRQQHLFHHLQL